MSVELELVVERNFKGSELAPYVSIFSRHIIMQNFFRNYKLNDSRLKSDYEKVLVDTTNPLSVSSYVVLMPNPHSAHQNVPSLFYSDFVGIDENDDSYPHPRGVDLEKLNHVKFKVKARYNLNAKSKNDVLDSLSGLGYNVVEQ